MNQSRIFSKMIRKKTNIEEEDKEEFNEDRNEVKTEEESVSSFDDGAKATAYVTLDAGPRDHS